MRIASSRNLSVLLSAGVVLCTASAAVADVSLFVSIKDQYKIGSQYFNSTIREDSLLLGGDVQLGVSFDENSQPHPGTGRPSPGRHTAAVARGGPGNVGVGDRVQYIQTMSEPTASGIYELRASSTAVARWSDIVVEPPVPGGPAMVPFSVNFLVHGTADVGGSTVVNPNDEQFFADIVLSFGMIVNQQFASGGNSLVVHTVDGSPTETLGNGIFTNYTGMVNATSQTVMVPVGTPFTIEMQMQSASRVSLPLASSMIISAYTDFLSTAAFEAVPFNLPDGYTANSVQANIVNNSFVPEPSSLLVLTAGAVLVAGRRRRASR